MKCRKNLDAQAAMPIMAFSSGRAIIQEGEKRGCKDELRLIEFANLETRSFKKRNK